MEGAGLTDVLIGRVAFDDVVQRPHGMDGVYLLAAGPVPPNPSELLGSRAMGRLLAELAKTYTVIIDAPPLLPVTDAAVLTANADGALIVLSSGKTLDAHLAESLVNLRQVNGHVLGVVLNKVRKGVRTGYYGYGYAYGAERSDDQEDVERRTRKPSSRPRPPGGDRPPACAAGKGKPRPAPWVETRGRRQGRDDG